MPANLDYLSATKKLNLKYWTAFCDYMEGSRLGEWLESPEPKHVLQFQKGLFGHGDKIRLGAHHSVRDHYISVVLHLRGSDRNRQFELLKLDSEQIEKEIKVDKKVGERLYWKPNARYSEIVNIAEIVSGE